MVVPRNPCCDQVFDCDVQMKKDTFFYNKTLKRKALPSLSLIPCGREKFTP